MSDKFRKLEQELLQTEKMQSVLHAIAQEEAKPAPSFVNSLEKKLLAKMGQQQEPRKTKTLTSFFDIFKRKSIALVPALLIVVLVTYFLNPFAPEFAPRAFLTEASAHYDQQLTILQKGGQIYHTKIQSQNGPDLKDYVIDTSYPDTDEFPPGFDQVLAATEEGQNQIITETWSHSNGNYFVISKYAQTNQTFGAYMLKDGQEYFNNDYLNILDEYQDDPTAQQAFKDQLFTCIDQQGDSLNLSPYELSDLELEGEITIDNNQVVDIEGLGTETMDPSDPNTQYYKEFGALYSSENNRKSIMETLSKRENVLYDGEQDIEGTTHHVFKFVQPLPEDFDHEIESLTWLYFTEDYQLTRQDTGMRVNNKEYKINSLYFLEENYTNDESIFTPEKHGLTKPLEGPGCFYLFTGEEISIAELKEKAEDYIE